MQNPSVLWICLRRRLLRGWSLALRRVLAGALLLPRPLLNRSEFLQLLGREHGLDLGAALLANLHYLLLLLLHGQGIVVAHSHDLFIFVVNHGSDFLFLIWRKLEFIFDSG
jgi:hypothetical protein